MPARSLSDLRFVDAAGWRSWWQVDVLQCVAASLIMLQILVWLARTPRRFVVAAAATGTAVVISTPFIWAVEWTRFMSAPFASYLNGRTDSLFPLFPWTAYIFAGAALAYLYVAFTPRLGSAVLALAGVSALIAGVVLQRLPVTIYRDIEYWKTSPNLFLLRFGAVCLVLAVLAAAAAWLVIRSSVAQTLARESLFMYIAHVLVLYGSSWTLGLRHTVGATLTPLYTIATILVLLPAMAVAGIAWNWLKGTMKPIAKDIVYAAAAGFPRIAS